MIRSSLPLLLILGALVGAAMPPLAAQMQRQPAPAPLDGPLVVGPQILRYGEHRLQQLEFWPAPDARFAAAAPLVIFVHGGGWQRGDMRMMRDSPKLARWQAAGYAVASINYRLVPEASVEQQAADVAAALAYLRTNAARHGIDPRRIALVGHSAGAHLVALVGTDPAYLRAAGLGPESVAGILALDGAAYDVPWQIAEGERIMRDTYRQAFGEERERQLRLSPVHQAGAPNAPEFLLLHAGREDARRQSTALAEALRAGGTAVELHGVAGRGLRGHMEINRRLGEPDYPATPIVDRWLARIFR